jgi:hypothetical protein
MEKIDLNNYEAYFLDFMEGTLSAEERHDLFAFLELHPELKSEMEEDFGSIELNPEAITFEGKEQLKIDESALILTANTVDDIMIASVEGQLSASHENQLLNYVKANNLDETFAYYKATILKPDTAIVFAEKRKLKVKTGIIISLPLMVRMSAIAAVGIILLTVAFRNWDGETSISSDEPNNQFASHARTNSNIAFSKIRLTNDAVNVTTEDEREYNNTPRQENIILPEVNGENIAMENEPVVIDTTNTNPYEWKVPDNDELDDDSDIVDQNPKEIPAIVPDEEEEEDVIIASVKTEEPYKLVTDAASNLVNRDVKFTRDRSVASNDYVAYSFKVGKFEFERKKSR